VENLPQINNEIRPQKSSDDFEQKADILIEQYFAEKGSRQDNVELDEKRLIIKELALASKKSEIISHLNTLRTAKNAPLIGNDFDIYYYKTEYASLIETLSLYYAENLSKKYRLAGRITRIAKLSDMAEAILDRIRMREEIFATGEITQKLEELHNQSIKLFSQLCNAIDEQMGKLKITKIDLSVRSQNEKSITEGAADVRNMIEEALRTKFREQLPAALDANFVDITDYTKCEFAEQLGQIHHCWYFNSQCKVQTGDLQQCPHFVNRALVHDKDYMEQRYKRDSLSIRQIAEIAGCKEVDEVVLERVRNRLKDFGLYKKPAG